MQRAYNFAPDARLERRGNTDYVNVVRNDGRIVSRPVRVFRGDLGSWRVTSLGMKWFARPGQPDSEYVLQTPVRFGETSRRRMDDPAIHYGWYPVSNLNPTLRRRIQDTFRAPPPADKPAEIRRIKDEVLRILNAEMHPDLLQEVTISFDSDQLTSIDPADTREWRLSELRTTIDVDN